MSEFLSYLTIINFGITILLVRFLFKMHMVIKSALGRADKWGNMITGEVNFLRTIYRVLVADDEQKTQKRRQEKKGLFDSQEITTEF